MQLDTADPAVRYCALALVAVAALSFLAVVVHGYWTQPNYQPPGMVAAFLGGALTTAVHVLGVQSGTANQQLGVEQGAKVARNGVGAHDNQQAA